MKPKVFVTGTGRAGTSFLMMLLTRLGFDTGFSKEDAVDPKTRAGFEKLKQMTGPVDAIRQRFAEAPEIIKAPQLSFPLRLILRDRLTEIRHVIIPVRGLLESAVSRIQAGLAWSYGSDFDEAPKPKTVEEQFAIHAQMLGFAVEACVLYDVPFTPMKYPQLVEDPGYCFGKLGQVFDIPDQVHFRKVYEGCTLRRTTCVQN